MTEFLRALSANWKHRWHAAQTLQRRQSEYTFYGPGIYVTVSLTLVAAAVVLSNYLRFAERNAIFVATEPLFLPILLNTVLASIYLAFLAAITSSRERDRGTMEVLLYGPVDEISFLFGHFLAQLKVYLGVVVVIFVWANITTWLLNLEFSLKVYAVLATSIATAAAVIAFGLLIASLGGKARTTLLYFLIIMGLMVGLQLGDEVLRAIPLDTNPSINDPVLLLRTALAFSSSILRWVSPYMQLRDAMVNLLNQNLAAYALNLGVSLLQIVILLGGSFFILFRKGTRG